jgi:branched-chain amino acid transport system substrate-binding protein
LSHIRFGLSVAAALLFAALPAAAQKNYSPGATDTSIKIGQTEPYSGPASSNSSNGTADQAFFKMVNDQGGINGRKIDFDSVDDAYAPPRTLEQTRKLVEQDNVLFFYRSMGTAPNMAIARFRSSLSLAAPAIGITRPNAPTAWARPRLIRPRLRSSRAMRCR